MKNIELADDFSLKSTVLLSMDEGGGIGSLQGHGTGIDLMEKVFSSEELVIFYANLENSITFWDECLTKKCIEELENSGIYHGLTIKKNYDANRTIFFSFGFKNKTIGATTFYLNWLDQHNQAICDDFLEDVVKTLDEKTSKIKPTYVPQAH